MHVERPCFQHTSAKVAFHLGRRHLSLYWMFRMKLYLAIAAVGAVCACATPQQTPQNDGYRPVFATDAAMASPKVARAPASTSPLRAAPTAVVIRPTTTLPFHAERSRYLQKTGHPQSERASARGAIRAGGTFWEQATSETVSIGKYRLKLRQVQVDGYDFIVAQNASHTIGASRFQLVAKTRALARTKTACTVRNDTYYFREDAAQGVIFPLNC